MHLTVSRTFSVLAIVARSWEPSLLTRIPFLVLRIERGGLHSGLQGSRQEVDGDGSESRRDGTNYVTSIILLLYIYRLHIPKNQSKLENIDHCYMSSITQTNPPIALLEC